MSHPFSGPEDESGSVPATLGGVIAVAMFAAASLGFHASMGWVPLLDSANLALHEAGHPLVGILSNQLAVYGGTLFQLAFPVAVALHFHRRDHAVGAAAGVIWLAENLLNVARYMADARVQQLPLVGGGDHDWAEIFTRWHLINADTKVAGLTRILAVALMAWAVWWLYRRWRATRPDGA